MYVFSAFPWVNGSIQYKYISKRISKKDLLAGFFVRYYGEGLARGSGRWTQCHFIKNIIFWLRARLSRPAVVGYVRSLAVHFNKHPTQPVCTLNRSYLIFSFECILKFYTATILWNELFLRNNVFYRSKRVVIDVNISFYDTYLIYISKLHKKVIKIEKYF